MIEIGEVIKLDGGQAEVLFQRNPACGNCTACRAQADGTLKTMADNAIGAKLGERVEVEFSSRSFARAALIVFGLPVVLLFLGYYLGGVLGALLFLLASFGLILILDRFFSKNNAPRIIALCTKRP
ncbi:MAG: SoxR reducing system RseC family protein [Candidatus Margulisiibacteriota bacterium]|jgi:sigma-E factor negative regulatory protein RseC